MLYTVTLTGGFFCLLASGLWVSRLLKSNLLEDVFNTENESFMQETRLMENEYSINLPTKFWYRKKGMERLDKCGESLQGKHDFRHAGER